jgi:hypothetical protein
MAEKVSWPVLLDEVVNSCTSGDKPWMVALSTHLHCQVVVVILQVAVSGSGPPRDRVADCVGGHSTATLVDLIYLYHTSGILYHYCPMVSTSVHARGCPKTSSVEVIYNPSKHRIVSCRRPVEGALEGSSQRAALLHPEITLWRDPNLIK